jgi:hypothetical protein
MDDTRCRTEDLRFAQAVGPRGQWVIRHAALVAALSAWAGVASGCGDKQDKITEVERDQMCPSAQAQLCSNAAAAAAAREASSDATSRSVPALENATARAALASSLAQLDAALVAGNITKARAALIDSRTALGAAGGQPGDAPDLGAIELLLDHVAPLIGS